MAKIAHRRHGGRRGGRRKPLHLNVESLSKYNRGQLLAKCQERGLKTRGSVKDLAERLIADVSITGWDEE